MFLLFVNLKKQKNIISIFLGRKILKRSFITLLLTPFFISSCAVNDAYLTRLQGAGAGCLAGAGLGGAIGQSWEGALIGCGVGSIAGYGVGHYIANKKSQYVKKEDYLNAMVSEAETSIKHSRQLNRKLASDIALLEKKQKQYLSQVNKTSSSQKILLAQREQTEELITQTENEIKKISDDIEVQKQVLVEERQTAPTQFVKVTGQNINDLESEKSSLKIALAQLEAIDRRRAY